MSSCSACARLKNGHQCNNHYFSIFSLTSTRHKKDETQILRWTEILKKKDFETAILFEKAFILEFMYPKVQHLMDYDTFIASHCFYLSKIYYLADKYYMDRQRKEEEREEEESRNKKIRKTAWN